MRNLHKVQAGRGVNAPGTPEIPEAVFEELLVNALAHRDYLVSAPIRLFVFDDRIEIISPGHLPNSLTVEKIRAGNSNIRNPVLVTYIAKGLLPYHGLGSGIKRALERWPHIDFKDDREGCLFTVTVHRDATRLAPVCDTINETISTSCETISAQDEPISETIEPRNETIPSPNETLDDVQSRLLALIHADPQISYAALVDGLGKGRATVARQIAQLKEAGLLRRVGSKKTGHWEVLGA